MTGPSTEHHVLPDAAAGRLLHEPLGTLLPRQVHDSEPVAFTAYDHFDQPLRRSGRLLLAGARSLDLVSGSGAMASQPAHRRPGFVADFEEGPVKQALADLSPLRRLLPVGCGEWHSATVAFVDDEGKTHCRSHLIHFHTHDGDVVVMLRLQALKGYERSFDLLRRHVVNLGSQAIGFEALYQRLFPNHAWYDSRPEIAVPGNATAFDMANRIIAAHIPIMRANESGVIADHDTEFLHDYRIQLRKIRSVLSLFKGVYADDQTADLKARFSALAAPTGPLRDLDVFLLDQQKYHDLLPETLHEGLDALSGILHKRRAEVKAQVSHHLLSRTYEREVTKLSRRFDSTKGLEPGVNAHRLAPEFARDCIWKRYRKVRKAANAIDAHTPDPTVHALRIQCKKLRYLIEFFQPLFPARELTRVLRPLKGLQNNLGRFNDCSVQQDKLHALLQQLKQGRSRTPPKVGPSVGAVITVLHGQQLRERARVTRNVARFNRRRTQRAFSDLFQQRKDNP